MAHLKGPIVARKIVSRFLFAALIALLFSAMYFRAKAVQEIVAINNTEIYIRWHLKEFNYATYYIHLTPIGIPVEGIIQESSLPFTFSLAYSWDFKKFVLAQKCLSIFKFELCGPPSHQEISELKQLLRLGRLKSPFKPEAFPGLPEDNSQRTPVAYF